MADSEEIRKIEQEFAKKMQRAKKSYGTRMDNLHRSKEEAEAQHLMTLEKHQKERIEFDKRVRLAEEEQARRLNQIQKEFNERKNEVRQQRAKQPSGGTGAMQNGAGDVSRPPLHGGHKRSSSHFEASVSALPPQPSPMTDHKRINSEPDIVHGDPSDPSNMQHLQGHNVAGIPSLEETKRGGLASNLPKGGPSRPVGNNAAGVHRDRSGSSSS